MAVDLFARRLGSITLPRLKLRLLISVLTLVIAVTASSARADRASFRTLNASDGLTSLGGACMEQDSAGYMLICSEHGLFTYDGRRFDNLGPAQGLREGGVVFNVAVGSSGRVAIGYPDAVFVSDRALDPGHPPSSLQFQRVALGGKPFFVPRPHRLVAWQDGFALLTENGALRITLPEALAGAKPAAPYVRPLGYSPAERELLKGATSLFGVDGHLWESFADDRVCLADPGATRCFAAADGLTGGPWFDVVAGFNGTVLARSLLSVATFDPASNRWSVTDLSDQDGRYSSYPTHLGLFRTPDGGLITQANHGIVVLQPDGWHEMTTAEGAPSGNIMAAISDTAGQLWLQVFGRGLVRWVGYSHWESLSRSEDGSEGIPWQTARTSDQVWLSSDTGVREIKQGATSLHLGTDFPGTSFALAAAPDGRLWSSYGAEGLRVIDPRTGHVVVAHVPSVDVIRIDGAGHVWIGTETGLFEADDASPGSLHVADSDPGERVRDVALDRHGGVYYLSLGRLRHRYSNGADRPVTGPWPEAGFDPDALALAADGSIWVGGAGGLFKLSVSNDMISRVDAIPVSDIRTNTIAALMIDHRGWVWVGTALGVSIYNGDRWVSVDNEEGLISDDVDEGGLREDPDGSVWIVTSQGVSHLLDPAWLFANRTLKVAISDARLDGAPLRGEQIPFSTAALSLQFSTPGHPAHGSVFFRYRLSGVDDGFADSSSGTVRYPFIPPGKHVLTVRAYDELAHQWSRSAQLSIDMAYPWWRQWWAEGIWALLGIGLVYVVVRLRLRALLARQHELERHVAAATAEMRMAQAELRYQASHDRLTGLLNRSEIERQLAAKLAREQLRDEVIVALIDIDHFKRINDDHGHLAGDDVLRSMGRIVTRAVGEGEFAGRYGGEEILLVLDDSDGRGAERILDLHLAIRHDTFKAGAVGIRVTCSIGLAWAVAGDDWESLIGRADDALYHAKRGGRDRVVESSRPPRLAGLPGIRRRPPHQ